MRTGESSPGSSKAPADGPSTSARCSSKRSLGTAQAEADERRTFGLSEPQDDLVSPQLDGSGYHRDRLRELFQAAAKRANVPVIRLHDARRSCTTPALDAARTPRAAALGHSLWNITMDPCSHRVHRLQRDASWRLEESVVPWAGVELAVT